MQELRIYMETLWRLEHRLCPAWAARRKLRQKANTRSTEDGGKKVECRGNICLGTREIGCEMSTAVCLQGTEIDRGRVGVTDKKIVTVAWFKSDLPSLQFRSDEAAYINLRWALTSLRRRNVQQNQSFFPPHEVSDHRSLLLRRDTATADEAAKSSAPPGRSWGVHAPVGMHNPTSVFWVLLDL